MIIYWLLLPIGCGGLKIERNLITYFVFKHKYGTARIISGEKHIGEVGVSSYIIPTPIDIPLLVYIHSL